MGTVYQGLRKGVVPKHICVIDFQNDVISRLQIANGRVWNQCIKSKKVVLRICISQSWRVTCVLQTTTSASDSVQTHWVRSTFGWNRG